MRIARRAIVQNRLYSRHPSIPFGSTLQILFQPCGDATWIVKRMLPYPVDEPACCSKKTSDRFISCFISSDLGVPVTLSGFRHSAVPRATVPEAAIHKYNETVTTECEIGLPRERLMPSPPGNTACPQYTCETQFSGQIAGGTDCGHDFRPLLPRKSICHKLFFYS